MVNPTFENFDLCTRWDLNQELEKDDQERNLSLAPVFCECREGWKKSGTAEEVIKRFQNWIWVIIVGV